MTKKERQKLFNEEMNHGYDIYKHGLLTIEEWNTWSWTCYKFQDEEITYDELKEKLYGDA